MLSNKITLKSAGTAFLRYVNATMSHNTYNDYRNTINAFLNFLDDDMCLLSVTDEHIIHFLEHMRQTPFTRYNKTKYRSPKTMLNIHTGLSSFFRWASERDYVKQSVMQHIPRPKVPEKPVIPLSQTEIKQLLAACTSTRPWKNRPLTVTHRPTAGRDRAMLALLLETGVRVSELCDLLIEDVIFERSGGYILIQLGKGNNSRLVPFGRNCARLLTDWLITRPDKRSDDYLFISILRNFGHPMTRNSVGRIVSELGKKVGVQPLGPHRLRTTALCQMAANGMTAPHLQRIAGHKDIKTTMRYIRAANLNLKQAVSRASTLDNIRF